MVGQAVVAGLLAGFGVAIPVGAIGALLVALSARTSLRVGAAAALGVATVDGAYALAALLGGSALAAAIRPWAGPLRWVAGVVLLGIAARAAVVALRARRAQAAALGPAAPDPAAPDRAYLGLATPGRAYLGLVGLTALNPTTLVYFAALVLGRQAAGPTGLGAGLLFVGAAFAASASWQLLLACGGSALGRVANTPTGRLATTLVASAVIAALAARLLLG